MNTTMRKPYPPVLRELIYCTSCFLGRLHNSQQTRSQFKAVFPVVRPIAAGRNLQPGYQGRMHSLNQALHATQDVVSGQKGGHTRQG